MLGCLDFSFFNALLWCGCHISDNLILCVFFSFPVSFTFFFFYYNTVVASQEQHLGPNGFCSMVHSGHKDTKKVAACVEWIKGKDVAYKRSKIQKLRRAKSMPSNEFFENLRSQSSINQ